MPFLCLVVTIAKLSTNKVVEFFCCTSNLSRSLAQNTKVQESRLLTKLFNNTNKHWSQAGKM